MNLRDRSALRRLPASRWPPAGSSSSAQPGQHHRLAGRPRGAAARRAGPDARGRLRAAGARRGGRRAAGRRRASPTRTAATVRASPPTAAALGGQRARQRPDAPGRARPRRRLRARDRPRRRGRPRRPDDQRPDRRAARRGVPARPPGRAHLRRALRARLGGDPGASTPAIPRITGQDAEETALDRHLRRRPRSRARPTSTTARPATRRSSCTGRARGSTRRTLAPDDAGRRSPRATASPCTAT